MEVAAAARRVAVPSRAIPSLHAVDLQLPRLMEGSAPAASSRRTFRRSDCVPPLLGLAAAFVVARPTKRLANRIGSRKSAANAWQGRPGRAAKVSRRFFENLFGPEVIVDPEDPGRPQMAKEHNNNTGGTFVARELSDCGWAHVSSHTASEQDEYWPGGKPPGPVIQEWRELRLAENKGGGQVPDTSQGVGQSVVKVSVCGDKVEMVRYCMTLGYTKTLTAAAMTGSHLQGALALDKLPKQRALVIGLGAGSIPMWLEHSYPAGTMTVDALEIDPAVVKVVQTAMGFPAAAMRPCTNAVAAAADAVAGGGGQSVRVYPVPGEAFVEELAKAASGKDYKYDMIFIDAFDKMGKVPPVLVEANGVFLKALEKLIAPKGTVVMNLLVGMAGSGSSGGPKEIRSMVGAVKDACCLPSGEVFTVRPPMDESSGNQIFCYLRSGRDGPKENPLKADLKTSAEAINLDFPVDILGKKIRFEFARRVNFAYVDWEG